jgi:DNA-binding beta-propeller fold protein YncE
MLEVLYINPITHDTISMISSLLLVCLCLFITLMIIILSHEVNKVFGDSVISVIPVGNFPQALVLNPSNNNIYVANRDSGTVSVIET